MGRYNKKIKLLLAVFAFELAVLILTYPAGFKLNISEGTPGDIALNQQGERTVAEPKLAEVVQDYILVKFKSNISSSGRRDLLNRHGLAEISEFKSLGVKMIGVSPEDTAEEVVDRLNTLEHKSIEYAELDYERQPSLNPNDPNYPSQWMFTNIKAPIAWSTTTGSPIKIAVIDTGVKNTHEDLIANLIPGWNFRDNNADTNDTAHHGTLMTGTIAAMTNNGVGVAGTCWTCKIMPLKVSNSGNTATDSTVAQALLYAKDQGVKIAVIGYAVTGSSVVGDAAQQFVAAGGIVVVPVGNDGLLVTTIPNSPYMITVGGTSTLDGPYLYSNSGPHVDISAPGFTLSTTADGYGSNTGTSFSAAYVAGVAALVQTINPSCVGNTLATHLNQNSDDLGSPGFDNVYGWGRLNASTAITQASSCGTGGDTQAPTVSVTSPSFGSNVSGIQTVSATASDNVGVVGVQFKLDGSSLGVEDTSSPYSISWDTTQTVNGSHTLTAVARDAAGNLGTSSGINVNVNNDLTPPVVSSVQAVSVGSTTATVTWLTNELSDSQVDYGLSNIYGFQTAPNPNLITSHSVSLSGLSASTPYHYRVRSRDAAGNLSVSGDFTFSTSALPDSTPPSVPTNLRAAAVSSSQINLTWAASTDNVGVVGYKIYRGSIQIATATGTSYSDSGLSPSTNYTYAVSAYDAAGNNSAQSSQASATTSALPDTTPPSTPTNLTAQAPDSTRVNLAWGVSTDNVGVTGYRVYRNSVQIATATVTNYADTSVMAGTTYSYFVRAYDAAGNLSLSSNTATVSVPSATTSVVVTSYAVVSKTDTTAAIQWTTNIPSTGTVYYGTSSGNLNLSVTDVNIALTHSINLTGLTKSTKYYYNIVAVSQDGSSTITSPTTNFRTKGGDSGGGKPVAPECSDNKDNDSDGTCDFDGCKVKGSNLPADAQCTSVSDSSESI